MQCQQARELFHAHLDGELTPAMESELSAHVVKCAGCRQALALLELTGHIVRSDQLEPVPSADFTDRLLACMPQPTGSRIFRMRNYVLAGSALAAAALIAIVMFPAQPATDSAGGDGMVLGQKETLVDTAHNLGAEVPVSVKDADNAHRAPPDEDVAKLLDDLKHKYELIKTAPRSFEGIMQPALDDASSEEAGPKAEPEEIEDL